MSDDKFENDIKSAIDQHLPGMVGEELRKRLEKAKMDEAELEKVQQDYRSYKENHRTLDIREHELDDKAAKLAKIEQEQEEKGKELTQREVAVTSREGLIAMRETHAREIADSMRGVVRDVFCNNRFKYERTDVQTQDKAIPVEGNPGQIDPNGGYAITPSSPGHVEHHTDENVTKTTVEGEGDVGGLQ